MKFLLPGGAGFIGHHLTERLLSLNQRVVVIDNLTTGSQENIDKFRSHKNFEFHFGNAQDRDLTQPLVQDCDVVFNLAASVGVKKIVSDPIECIENNILVASNLMRLCAKYSKRIFLFSTSEVYGKSTEFPFTEESDVVIGPYHKLRWSYATSKLIDDFLGRAYFEKHHTAVTMIRLFNTIGAGQLGYYGMVVPRFFEQALSQRPISVYGTGMQTRCFTDVRDVVNILISLIDNKNSYGELINIGSDEEISILRLAELIKELTGSSSTIEFVSFEKAYGANFEDMNRRVPSKKKLLQLTGKDLEFNLTSTLGWIYESLLRDSKILSKQFLDKHDAPHL